MTTVLLAGAAAVAVWLSVPADPPRLGSGPPGRSVSTTADERGHRRWLWSALAGLGAWAFVSGTAGLAVGVVAAGVVWVVIGRAETPAQRARRVRVRAELPHVVGLLAAAVRGGLPPADALALVCVALPGPAADSLATRAASHRAGRRPRGGVEGRWQTTRRWLRWAGPWPGPPAPVSRSPMRWTGSATSWPPGPARTPRTRARRGRRPRRRTPRALSPARLPAHRHRAGRRRTGQRPRRADAPGPTPGPQAGARRPSSTGPSWTGADGPRSDPPWEVSGRIGRP